MSACAHVARAALERRSRTSCRAKTKVVSGSARACIHTRGRSVNGSRRCRRRSRDACARADLGVYFDGRLTEGAIVLAKKACCSRRWRGSRVLVEASRLRPSSRREAEALADAVVTSNVTVDGEAGSSLGDTMMRVLESAPDARSVTTTLGARGSPRAARDERAERPRVRRAGDVHR